MASRQSISYTGFDWSNGSTGVLDRQIRFLRPYLNYGVAICCFMVHLTIQFSSGMLAGQLTDDFGLDAVSVAVMMGMVFYPNILLQIPAGIVTDRFGARKVLTTGALVCAVGAYGFSSATGFYTACLFRFCMGAGLSFAFVSMAYLMANWMPRDSFSMAFAIAEMLSLTFAIFAMRYLAVTLPHGSWRDFITLLMYVAIGLAIMVSVLVKDKPDYLEESQQSLSLEDLFVQLKLFMLDGKMWANGVYAGLLFSCLTCFVAQWGPNFLSQATIMNLEEASSMCSTITFGLIVSCPMLSWVLPKIENIHMVLSLCAMMTAIGLMLVIVFPMMDLWVMRICLFLVGFCSVGYLVPFTIAHYYVRPGSKSTAIGFTNMLATIFGPLLSFVIAVIMKHHSTGSDYSLSDFQLAMYLLPVAMFLASIICFFMPKTHKPGRNLDI